MQKKNFPSSSSDGQAMDFCPEEEILADYLESRLSSDQASMVENHLIDCQRCRKTVIFAAGAETSPFDGSKEMEILAFEDELSQFETQLGIKKEDAPQRAKPRVMIVDDDPDYLESLSDALASDYAVVACSSGFEALEKMTDQIQTVILDIKMPGMDGLEVAERLKQDHQDIPLLFNTGYPGEYGQEIIKDRYESCGYVTKDHGHLLMDHLQAAITQRSPQPIL